MLPIVFGGFGLAAAWWVLDGVDRLGEALHGR